VQQCDKDSDSFDAAHDGGETPSSIGSEEGWENKGSGGRSKVAENESDDDEGCAASR